MYAGFRGRIVTDCLYSGVQFSVYEWCKEIRGSKTFRIEEPLFFGALAGTVATVVVNPLEVVVMRLMVQGHGKTSQEPRVYEGVLHCFSKIYRKEGLRSFLSGCWPCVVRIMPNTALGFGAYELARFNLGS